MPEITNPDFDSQSSSSTDTSKYQRVTHTKLSVMGDIRMLFRATKITDEIDTEQKKIPEEARNIATQRCAKF